MTRYTGRKPITHSCVVPNCTAPAYGHGPTCETHHLTVDPWGTDHAYYLMLTH